MRNKDKWVPSKFVFQRGRLAASRNRGVVGAGSRLITNIVAEYYGTRIPQYVRGRLLDLGCGLVPLYAAYKDYVSDNICVDWENTLHRNNHLDATCDLTQKLAFHAEEFDTIILSDVLEHIPEPGGLWQEMWRVLRPGANVLLNVPFFYWLHETPHDYYRYTEFALRRFAESARFRILVLDAIGGVPEVVTDLFAKQLQTIPAIGASLAIAAQSAVGLYLRTSFGKKTSQKTGKAFPLGYFMVAEKTTA